MDLHPAVSGFDAAAEEYERGRPGYSDATVDWIVKHGPLVPGSTVVDLAAGTGKLTRLLSATGARVVAVEPVAGMRERLRSVLPGVEVYDGTAESMPLADNSADVVTVAQAFHWFDGDRALPEIHRVLRPGGKLMVIFNRRDKSQLLQRELDTILSEDRGDTPHHGSGRWRDAFGRTALFGPIRSEELAMEQVLDADGVVDRVLSVSFMAQLPATEKAERARRARELVDRYGYADGRVALRYVVECHRAEARPAADPAPATGTAPAAGRGA